MTPEIKNPLNYGYLGDETITMTAREFMLLKNAVEHGINSTLESYLPEVTRYVNVETSSIAENPTQEEIESGKVVLVTDRQATFSPNNVKSYYTSKLTHDMVNGQQLVLEIHERHVELGVAKSSEELAKLKEEEEKTKK